MNAYIYDAVRTPRGRGNQKGSLAGVPALSLALPLMRALAQRQPQIKEACQDLIMGCVTPIGEQGGNIAKAVAQAAQWGDHLTGVTLNRFCGSGLEAVNQAAAYLSCGAQDLILAGGVESMSRVAMGSDGGALMADPQVAFASHYIPQGISADLIASKYGYSRQDLDNYALSSQQRAGLAQERGYFKPSLVPIFDPAGRLLLGQDEQPRPQTSLEALANLSPAFEQLGAMGFDAVALKRYPELEVLAHRHHAGNSSAIVDGAALVLLGSLEMGAALGLRPRARIRAFATCGTEPTIMLLGPVPATQRALKQAGMSLGDIDLFEVNEAFAAIPLFFMEALGLGPEKINVNGGAIALGHPLGATGAVLLGTLLDELERRDLQTGLVTLCIGGGMGIATIIERV